MLKDSHYLYRRNPPEGDCNILGFIFMRLSSTCSVVVYGVHWQEKGLLNVCQAWKMALLKSLNRKLMQKTADLMKTGLVNMYTWCWCSHYSYSIRIRPSHSLRSWKRKKIICMFAVFMKSCYISGIYLRCYFDLFPQSDFHKVLYGND